MTDAEYEVFLAEFVAPLTEEEMAEMAEYFDQD